MADKYITTQNIYFKGTGEYIDKGVLITVDAHSREKLLNQGLIVLQGPISPKQPVKVKRVRVKKSEEKVND